MNEAEETLRAWAKEIISEVAKAYGLDPDLSLQSVYDELRVRANAIVAEDYVKSLHAPVAFPTCPGFEALKAVSLAGKNLERYKRLEAPDKGDWDIVLGDFDAAEKALRGIPEAIKDWDYFWSSSWTYGSGERAPVRRAP